MSGLLIAVQSQYAASNSSFRYDLGAEILPGYTCVRRRFSPQHSSQCFFPCPLGREWLHRATWLLGHWSRCRIQAAFPPRVLKKKTRVPPLTDCTAAEETVPRRCRKASHCMYPVEEPCLNAAYIRSPCLLLKRYA